jgi:hypothetical protein
MLAALSSLALLNLLIFFLGLIPNGGNANIRNDAQMFWCVLRHTDEAREIRLYHELMRMRVLGVRPRDYSPELIDRLMQHAGRPDMCLVFADAIMKASIDHDDIGMTAVWYQRMRELNGRTSAVVQNLGQAELACFELLYRGDARSAREKFASVQLHTITPKWLQHRIAAAARTAEGAVAAACYEINSARSCLPEGVPYAQFELALLDKTASIIGTIEL